MEISNRTIILFVITIMGYIYLSDVFNKQSVHNRLLKAFNGSNHSMVDLLLSRSNTMAAIVSTASTTILNSLPVIKIIFLESDSVKLENFFKSTLRDPRKILIGLGIASLGMLAKHNNYTDFGFYGNHTVKNVEKEEEK